MKVINFMFGAIFLSVIASVLVVGCVSPPTTATYVNELSMGCYGANDTYQVDAPYFKSPENCEVLLAAGMSTSIACEDLKPTLVCVNFRKCVDRNRAGKIYDDARR